MTEPPQAEPNRRPPDKSELEEPVLYGPIEDIGDTTTFTPLRRGARMNADTLGDTNPYLLSGYRIYEQLPKGTSPEPLGSGRVVGIVGEGALTRVYRILLDSPPAERAVKIALPDTPSAIAKASWDTWHRLSRLGHRSLVKVYKVGVHNGLPFVETALYRGRSLGELLQLRGRFPPRVAAAAGQCILDALEASCVAPAADSRVLPLPSMDDLLLTDGGTVLFLDYLLAGSIRLDTYLGSNALMRSVRYLPPEATARVDCTTATAVYVFGALLSELLTAAAPFGSDSPDRIAQRKARGLRLPWWLRLGRGRRLGALACACTATDPARRPSSIDTIRKALTSLAPSPAVLLEQLARDPSRWPAATR